jgi:hypothetical protein
LQVKVLEIPYYAEKVCCSNPKYPDSSAATERLARAATIGTNLIANGNVETATALALLHQAAGRLKATTTPAIAGTTTGMTNTWTTTGHTGRGLEAKVTGYVDGDVTWATAAAPVTASTSYQFTDWYKSDATPKLTPLLRLPRPPACPPTRL